MIERRRTQRLYEPILLSVRGEHAKSDRIEFETITRDIGGGGLCAVSPRSLSPGDRFCFNIQFARPGTKPFHAPVVTTRGIVQRVEALADGTFLFAVAFTMRGIR